jgi:DNA-binding NarL/FixJ family response regulator
VPGHSETIRVLVADAHSLFREAVTAVLQNEEDIDVVVQAGDGLQAVYAAEQARPDVCLVDASLPNCDGVRATALILDRSPDSRVIVVAADGGERLLLNVVEAGASGYVSKEAPLAELLDATRRVYRGETLIPGHLLGALLRQLIRHRRHHDQALRTLGRLTKREREVLALLADGADNEAIAQDLVISPQTARTHIQNILGKLDVHSRLEAAAFVMHNGIQAELVGV